jgi:hypothetical protein
MYVIMYSFIKSYMTLEEERIQHEYEIDFQRKIDWFIYLLRLPATFSNISAMSWRPVLVVEETGVHEDNHRPWASNW